MARRSRMSVEAGRALVASLKESGLSQAAFARREQIDDKQISFWVRKVRRLEESTATPDTPAFVRVQARPVMPKQDGVIEVVVHEDLRVQVRGAFDEQVLRRVLAVVRELAC